MRTSIGQLTFCTNIFPGESWEEHFDALQKYIPSIKKKLSSDKSFGIGLRLSNKASLQLTKQLGEFKDWLTANDCYVFTMNGFPYGNFHRTRVKDQVHFPDWTSNERLQYTLRLFRILAALLPANMDGGISTSPLSYKRWFNSSENKDAARDKSTWNIVQVIEQLYRIKKTSSQLLHLDIEPEPGGLIESGDEFIAWFQNYLLPAASSVLQEKYQLRVSEAEEAIRDHVRLCYDVCHFAVGYEDMKEMLNKLNKAGIRIGKWQLSSALKLKLSGRGLDRQHKINELKKFNEPVYLHQVIASKPDGNLLHYPDLPDALTDPEAYHANEWRSHFHVPLFIKDYGLLNSTQDEVTEAIITQKIKPLTDHLEVETYTWDILPDELKLPLDESVIREINWVIERIVK